jgi:hypothetical protein
MTFLYFACTECKVFIEIGRRWAARSLDAGGVVKGGEQISVEAILAAEQYWNPPKAENSGWLYNDVLPAVRSFLEKHNAHRIIFGLQEEAVAKNDDEMFEWMQVGHLLQPLPRYYVEVLGFTSWDQVVDQIAQDGRDPWWMTEWDEWPKKARNKFEECVRANDAS